MAESRCPDCGAPVSPGAAVCPACGFPLRPHALAQGGRAAGARLTAGGRRSGGSGFGNSPVMMIVVAVGIVMVVMIGIVAALVIPRFAQAGARAKEKQGEALLRWAYTAEQTHRAGHGAYTADVAVLTRILPPPADDGPKRYTLEVTTARGRELCLDAVPVAGSGLRAISMDALGSIYRSANCTGEIDASAPLGGGG